ncbi:MAG: polyphosphate:AMP phosphotransferase [Candidatus Latescibacterota bacterium]|nr:MAG: polyphosphate:AMP phosphotransferase [Candidatus Latescibacterota bacterium]
MLETVDLKQKLTREGYKALMPELEIRLGSLQRRAIQTRLPVIVLFEGVESAGKGELINRVVRSLDPRHYSVFSPDDYSDAERELPYPWRFWTRIPARGRMAIFDRSWDREVLRKKTEGGTGKREMADWYDAINSFERQLAADGYVIIKLFLHISEKEQKKRFKKLERKPTTGWRMTAPDRIRGVKYKDFRKAVDELLARTDLPCAPWHVIAAENRRFATVRIYETICELLESATAIPEATAAIAAAGIEAEATGPRAKTTDRVGRGRRLLDAADLSLTVSRQDYGKQLDRFQNQMRELQNDAYKKGLSVVVVYEGWDAAGKGGNIRRLTQGLDPRGYEVIPVGAPSEFEKRHHYLWRFWREIPKVGRIAIFDRSWYGRVLVERVEGFCTEAEWCRAYDEINEMEYQFTAHGIVLVKFWIHIDREVQLERFNERQKTPHKQWKITDEDWRNREKWDAYLAAVQEMLGRTSTKHAPWTVVESNCKHYARLKALKTVIKAMKKKL